MKLLILGLVFATVSAQNYRTTPVPILKQINRHNDDGSYSYGYENADGTFKIETKYPTGEVYGKYGYVGDDGKVREVEYGATRRGFEPTGTGINVPPPTLTNSADNSLDYNDDGQYREDPTVYYNKKATVRPKAFVPEQAIRQPVYNPPPQNYFQNRYTSPTSYNQPGYLQAPGHPASDVDLRTGSYRLSYSG